MSSIIDSLNPRQKDAASTIEGPLLVLAGAGTGKTRVITCRIAYMIEQGIPPSAILGVTFTNKAAKEMRERLNALIDPEMASKVTLGTFHSFCAKVLRREIPLAGHYNASFSIADDSDQSSLVRQAAAELGYTKEELATPEIQSYIGRMKNRLKFPEDALNEAPEHSREEDMAKVYERYQKMLEIQNTLDFDDILLLTLKIFQEHPEVLRKWQEMYQYLLIDEYQDTNSAQFLITRLLAGERMNLCVVGDDDQSIYSWRGAEVANILDFPKYFPGAKEVKLEQNYRSTNAILRAANAVIGKNGTRYEKNLWSAEGEGESVKVFAVENGDEEAKFVTDTMENMIAMDPAMSWSDFAVLYRSNHLSRAFELEMKRRGIRPKIIGGQEFLQRKEVKDAASYLKILVNPRDDQSLLRVLSVPPRGIGDKAVLALREMQKQEHCGILACMEKESCRARLSRTGASAAENFASIVKKYRALFANPQGAALSLIAKEYLEEIGYLNGMQRIYKDLKEAEKRQENVLEFITFMGLFEKKAEKACTLGDFLEAYSLLDESDRTDDSDDRDGPILSTVHASKGLEFPVVFLVGMEHNSFPHERSLQEGGLEEERRLFYVAITRAKRQLLITYAKSRFKFHEYVRERPSSFLAELPEETEHPDYGEFNKPMEPDAVREAFIDYFDSQLNEYDDE
ncbi:MAG: UvrD-helicase domain-containing protein [Lentisphaeria bacterium]|nr:UvrD-helicase domain-containing protein [Lentisphaeria bacterium]